MSRGDAIRSASKRVTVVVAIAALQLVMSCRQQMADQPSYSPLQESSFFEDGMSSRPEIPGTMARGHLRDDDHFYAGKSGDHFVATFPSTVTLATIQRGRERFNIYCAPCHDQTGRGDGMIVQRGYKKPPTFHSPELRERPVGYLFDVITNGFGVMPSYAHQVPTEDRWAIVAYLRVLQRSEHATLEDVPPSVREQLELEGRVTPRVPEGGRE